MMTIKVKVQFQDSFHKAGTLHDLSWTALETFLRAFLKTRSADCADDKKFALQLQYRDAAGQWHALTDEAQLTTAVLDGDKLIVNVVVAPEKVQEVPAPVDAAPIAAALDKTDAAIVQARRCRVVKFVKFVVAVLAVVLVLSHASDRFQRNSLAGMLTNFMAPSAFQSPQQKVEVQAVLEKYEMGAATTTAETTLFQSVAERHNRVVTQSAQLTATVERQAASLRELSRVNQELGETVELLQQMLRESARGAETARQRVLAEQQRADAAEERAAHLQKQLADAENAAAAAPREPGSVSALFLEVTRKFGRLAKSQVDDLTKAHLGKPLEELLDGSAVRSSVFDMLVKLNKQLDGDERTQQQQQQQQQRHHHHGIWQQQQHFPECRNGQRRNCFLQN